MANILGFDIGTYSIKIVKSSNGKIISAVKVDLPDNIVKGGRIVSFDAMSDIIRDAVKEYKLGNGSAASVIIPSAYALLRRFEMPLMTEEQLDLNLPYEFHDFLDMDKDKYYYDYFLNSISEGEKTEDGQDAPKRMDITAAAVPKEIIEEYKRMFKHAGLKLVTAVPRQCAYVNLLRSAGVSDDFECCFINSSFSKTNVDIFTGTLFGSGHENEVGLMNAIEQIALDRNVDIHVAREHFKTNLEDAQTKESSEVVFNAIAADLRKALNFYRFSNRDSELDTAYVFGSGTLVKPLISTLQNTTGFKLLDASVIMPKPETEIEDYGHFALAVGAVLQ